MKRGIYFSALLFFNVTLFLNAQTPAVSSTAGNNLTIKIAVMGPGDELYFWWGHMALIIEDSARGEAKSYDYGLFSWDSENFFLNFAFGRLLYHTGVSPAQSVYNSYKAQNRDVTLYTLDLPPEKKLRISEFAEWNVRPENRNYWYHHFRDNCVTRILNILDEAIDGQFYAKYTDAPGRFTLRGHVRRHTYFSPFWDWLLNFLMGQDIDKPITKRDEMFLPSEVALNISDFYYSSGDGNEKKLVSGIEIINTSTGRPPVLDNPPAVWPRALILSIAVSLLIFLMFILQQKTKKLGNIVFGLFNAVLGLFLGISGSLLFFMEFFTNHDYTFHNANVIFVNPLVFAAVPLSLIWTFSKKEIKKLFAGKILIGLWKYVFLGGIITMLIKISPRFFQQNQVTLSLLLPVTFMLGFFPRGIFKRKLKSIKND